SLSRDGPRATVRLGKPRRFRPARRRPAGIDPGAYADRPWTPGSHSARLIGSGGEGHGSGTCDSRELWTCPVRGTARCAFLRDRGALPGRSRDEVVALAQRLTQPELALRYRRAVSERRRFFELRRATEDVLSKIRYLNQVAISMRAGLLDAEGATQELEITEKQLHELVARLRYAAGVESDR